MKTAILLFAHGARDPEWASPMRRVQAAIQARAPGETVELAFLEFMSPNLVECATLLIAQGAEKIVILPMFIAQGGHLKREVPEILEQLRSTWPQVEFSLGRAIGEEEAVVQVMAETALRKAGLVFA